MRWAVGIALLLCVGCIEAPTIVADDRPPEGEPEPASSDTPEPMTEGEAEGDEGEEDEGDEEQGSDDPSPDMPAPEDPPEPDPDPDPDPTPFGDAAPELGLDAIHSPEGDYFVTSGQAWGDIDRDGFLDVVLTTQLAPNRVFMGGPGGVFSEPSWAAELAFPEQISAGAVFADFDNDGWLDLYILAMGENTLLRNLAGEGFEDVTQAAGVGDPGDGETATWGDIDDDGLLDLYVVNNNLIVPDALYRNLGGGSFADASALLPVDARARPGFSGSFFDYDLDGDVDLYVANDKHFGNVLWRNDGPGCGGWCLTDVSIESGAGIEQFSMGVAVGDYDADGDQDLFVTDIGPMALLQNRASQGSPHFVECSLEAGVMIDDDGWVEIGWGAEFLDYDNDGWLDLYVGLGKEDPGPQLPNVLLRNLGNGSFAKIEDVGGAADERLSWSVARVDYDDDGWVDVGVANRGEAFALYRNRGAVVSPERHHLAVELRAGADAGMNRDGVGARVALLDDEGRWQTREIIAGSSLGSGSSLVAHFGLGDALPQVVRVVWPDGVVEEWSGEQVPVDTRWVITRE